ncbi:hypothetical protein HDE_10582 [Halotydeus destructor]|nr:hypothetical protein HDE_10582 [Halotydeus destructor]
MSWTGKKCSNAMNKHCFSLTQTIYNAQITGQLKTKRIMMNLPRKYFMLQDIVPSPDVLGHVFLGFTQNGQYLLSYNITEGSLNLYIWRFNFDRPLQLLSSHVIFRSSDNGIRGDLPLVEDMYETTALYVFQWPHDNDHLLTLTVPDHHDPSIVVVTAISIADGKSYILEPGLITYLVVGWGKRHKFFDEKDRNSYEEFLTPGMIMSDESVCTFHTGTEVVCLQIIKDQCVTGCQTKPKTTLKSRVLDVERVLADALEDYFTEFVRLTTYELLVYGVDKSQPVVDAFIHAVISDKRMKESFTEFSIKWDVEKNNYVIDHCKANSHKYAFSDREKENVFLFTEAEIEHDLSPVTMKAHCLLKQMIQTQTTSPNYCLDNMPFVECQLSLNTLDSPTDIISISLTTHDCNLMKRET